MMESTEPKPISELRPTYENAMDYRGEPTEVCPCGSYLWNIKAAFNNYELAYYYLDMECAVCGSLATAPTPADMPEGYTPQDSCCPPEDICDDH